MGKWSLTCQTSASFITQLGQPKTAQQQLRKIKLLPIRVCLMPIRVWLITQPPNTRSAHLWASQEASPYAYGLPHTRMIRVSLSPYAYHQRRKHVKIIIIYTHTRMASPHTRTTLPASVCPCVWRVSAPVPSPPGHLIRVWPSVIRVWPETQLLQVCNGNFCYVISQFQPPTVQFPTEFRSPY